MATSKGLSKKAADSLKKFVLRILSDLPEAQKRRVARELAEVASYPMVADGEFAAMLHLAQFGSDEDLYAVAAYMIEKNALKPRTLKSMATAA